MSLLKVALLALLVHTCQALGNEYQLTFVVHSPSINGLAPETSSAQEILNANLNAFESQMPEVAANTMMVFPEYGLTTIAASVNRTFAISVGQTVPKPPDLINPCNDNETGLQHYAVRRLSCMAKSTGNYLVAHVVEVENCTFNCRPDGVNVFSTTVVFDREGTVVASYRKTHMYDEPALDKYPVMYMTSFPTDLDITFAVMNSADLLFAEPTLTILGGFYIFDFLVPMAFKGQLPFLTPLQIQHGWYQTHINEREVPLTLAANQLLDAQNGHAGQGVYFDTNVVQQNIGSDDATFTWGMRVNGKDDQDEQMEGRKFNFDRDDLTGYTYVPLLAATELTSLEACNNLFCCTLDYKVLEYDSNDFYYKFIVYNGPKTSSIGNEVWNVQVCAVVGCSGPTLESCTDPTANSNYTMSTSFETLEIKGSDFESTFNAIPTTLLNNYLTFKDYVFTKPLFGAPGEISIANVQGIRSIHTFGIYQATD